MKKNAHSKWMEKTTSVDGHFLNETIKKVSNENQKNTGRMWRFAV